MERVAHIIFISFRKINEGDELSRVGIADNSGEYSKQGSSRSRSSIALESFHGHHVVPSDDDVEKDGKIFYE